MDKRPELDNLPDAETFLNFYYLKEELAGFCRANGLPTGGSKAELTERIAHFLETGGVMRPAPKPRPRAEAAAIAEDAVIGPFFVCSEKHRAFFRERIGRSFSFNTVFQKWLKDNPGKTYRQAIDAYYSILSEKKTAKAGIGKQFEYNTYIRDFFAANHGRPLSEAIKCWKYKKSLPGHNRYEGSDLAALE
jgi:hypothetical protein